MKIVAVIGSPHKNGPSSLITQEILRGAKDAGHSAVIYRINEMDVKGCQACGFCKANYKDCRLNDDLKPYWNDLHECDVLIVSSPNYCSYVTGPMMTYMNRHYCLIMPDGTTTVKKPKELIGVFSQGQDQVNLYLDHYEEYLRDFEARNMKLKDIIIHTKEMPFDENSEIMHRAYQLGLTL